MYVTKSKSVVHMDKMEIISAEDMSIERNFQK